RNIRLKETTMLNRKSYRFGLLTFLAGCLLALPTDSFAAAVPLQNATATFSQTCCGTFVVGNATDGSFSGTNGWAIFDGANALSQTAVFETVNDEGFVGGSIFTFTLYNLYTPSGVHTLGSFRLSYTTDDRSTFADGLANGGAVAANWILL